jgi:hypothetical protein
MIARQKDALLKGFRFTRQCVNGSHLSWLSWSHLRPCLRGLSPSSFLFDSGNWVPAANNADESRPPETDFSTQFDNGPYQRDDEVGI